MASSEEKTTVAKDAWPRWSVQRLHYLSCAFFFFQVDTYSWMQSQTSYAIQTATHITSAVFCCTCLLKPTQKPFKNRSQGACVWSTKIKFPCLTELSFWFVMQEFTSSFILVILTYGVTYFFIDRVLLERLIVNRPHPWGLLITFIELIKNHQYKFWTHEFVHCAPEIEK